MFFISSVELFLCYSGEALGRPISTGVSNKLKNIDSNNGILISQKRPYIYVYISKLFDLIDGNVLLMPPSETTLKCNIMSTLAYAYSSEDTSRLDLVPIVNALLFDMMLC